MYQCSRVTTVGESAPCSTITLYIMIKEYAVRWLQTTIYSGEWEHKQWKRLYIDADLGRNGGSVARNEREAEGNRQESMRIGGE